MRYSASEKYEVIRLVEQSSVSVGQTLFRLGIRRSTFYGWLKRYQEGGMDGLEDHKPFFRWVWNKLPQEQKAAIIKLALDKPELSPRELAVTYIDEQSSFVSELELPPLNGHIMFCLKEKKYDTKLQTCLPT
ncbi:Homeodomain-like domain-containing protein [Nitrosomonas ureae]|uniref:Homeodomain-like domain-containing protein n=1 Tax=Nitrosomonas ureae TaxID=44577 RepID=A0A1H2I2G5_9PROT|nr:Homeodomain-like domain-containing protein [Nitrosomonas ureae]